MRRTRRRWPGSIHLTMTVVIALLVQAACASQVAALQASALEESHESAQSMDAQSTSQDSTYCADPQSAPPDSGTSADPQPTANSTADAAQSANTPDPQPPNPDHLLRRYDDLYDSSGTTARVEISIVTERKTRTLKLRLWGKGDDKALIVIDAPPRDAGTATLKVGKNLWNYLPKISRTIRVPPSMMMGSWMGSDLTNDDIVRDASYEEDYTSELVGRSHDPPGWKVRLTARPDAVGLWNSVEMIFSFDNELPVMAQFFDRKDRLSRTMMLGDVKNIGGRLIPTSITIVPEREEGRRTEFRYLDVEFDVQIPDDMFSLSSLERSH